ncbi:MAG: Type 1 glutamine amidotransferase-like domain-containing protein, partial [Nanoarchaeota archaeon]
MIRITKYILHGGNTGEINNDNNNFFKEMTSDLKGKVRILLNYFAREENEIKELAKQDRGRLLKYSKNKNLEFQIASVKKFEKQLIWANVMYMRGGVTNKLVKKLRKIKNIERLFEGKIIAGSSAGAYALSKYYWSNNVK